MPWPEALERGHAVFVLHGEKLHGGFALQRTRGGEKPQWLFIKRRDDHAVPGSDIAAERPESVASGVTLDDLLERANPVGLRRSEENPAGAAGSKRRTTVIVDCAHYRDGRRQHEGPMELDQAASVCQAGEGDGFVWMGLFEPEPEELAQVQERFGLHDLAVEDAQAFHLRPKFEQLRGARHLLRRAPHRELRGRARGGRLRRGIGVPVAAVHHHRQAGSRQRPARGAAAAGAPPGAAGGRTRGGPVGDPRQDRRRLRARSWRDSNATSRRSRPPCSAARRRRPSGSTSSAARSPTSTAPCIRCSGRSTSWSVARTCT